MAEHLHYDPRRHPLGQEEAGRRVPAVVEAMVPHAGGLLEPGKAPGHLAAVKGRPGLGAEDQVVVLPNLGAAALEQLAVPVGDELIDALVARGWCAGWSVTWAL